MVQYSVKRRTRKHGKGYGFLLFARKDRKKIMDTGIDVLKTTSKKVLHKAVESTGEVIENKITVKIVKEQHATDKSSRNVEKIIIPSGKRY